MPDLLKSEGLKASGEIAKQIITLSTGAVGFTVTFVDKFTVHAGEALHAPVSIYVAWGFFGLAILFSVWTLMAITGTFVSLDRSANGWPLTDAQKITVAGGQSNVKRPALLMLGAFLLAIAAMIVTGFELAL